MNGPSEPSQVLPWGVGWLLAATFGEIGTDSAFMAEDEAAAASMRNHLLKFFALLPKMPGKDGIKALVLGFEGLTEGGMWRHAVLMPNRNFNYMRWERRFSWRRLFHFVESQLPYEAARVMLWRASLEICVAEPELAVLAEIPVALEESAQAGKAPHVASALIQVAIAQGADALALDAVKSKTTPIKQEQLVEVKFPAVKPREVSKAEEEELAGCLREFGIDLAKLSPALQAPGERPLHLRPRTGGKAVRKYVPFGEAPSTTPAKPTIPVPVSMKKEMEMTPNAQRRRKKIDWDAKVGKALGRKGAPLAKMARLHGKSTPGQSPGKTKGSSSIVSRLQAMANSPVASTASPVRGRVSVIKKIDKSLEQKNRILKKSPPKKSKLFLQDDDSHDEQDTVAQRRRPAPGTFGGGPSWTSRKSAKTSKA
jgi:hypothetical protein